MAVVTLPSGTWPDSQGELSARLRDIEALADAALSRLGEQALLNALVERVKNVLQADTAAVLLLDQSASQLIATAASGIEDEVRQGVRIPLGTGFAGQVAASRKPAILTVVNHATIRNPLLVERGIKTVLGVPLLAGGTVIGVLYVGSLSGRLFGQQDTELLQLAADRASFALHTIMSQDDALAAMALHRSLIPAMLPSVPGASLAARYVTGSGNVGGDWYDVFPLPDGRLGITVGDVAGSGLAAAVIMGRMRSALRAYVLGTSDPAAVLCLLDRNVQYFDPDAMATVLYGLYLPETGEFTFSSAGHLPPVLAAPGGHPAAMLPFQPDPPIGAAPDLERRSDTLVIPPGALLCCFTDGLVERRDETIDLGIGRVAATLDELIADGTGPGDRPVPLAEEASAAVMRNLVGSAPARDDIALLTLYRYPAPPCLPDTAPAGEGGPAAGLG